MINEGNIKTGEEMKEEVNDEEVFQTREHRRILDAENVTEAKQLLLIHQVEFILMTHIMQ